ncbi:MAG: 2-dehydropantoate 2-reductase N-terminal domain-containing protein [Anaerolineae bacterium]
MGGSIGARLYQHGHDVVLICRGKHLERVQRNGLAFFTPTERTTLLWGPRTSSESDWMSTHGVRASLTCRV